MDMKLLDVAAGKAPADIVIKGGKGVNVFTGEIYDGGVCGGCVEAWRDVHHDRLA